MFSQNLVFNGLGTLSMTLPAAGLFFFKGKLSLPTIVDGGGASSCVVTITQNGTTVYTGLAGASGFETSFVCAANDVIAFVFSSSATADQGLNVIKSTVSIWMNN